MSVSLDVCICMDPSPLNTAHRVLTCPTVRRLAFDLVPCYIIPSRSSDSKLSCGNQTPTAGLSALWHGNSCRGLSDQAQAFWDRFGQHLRLFNYLIDTRHPLQGPGQVNILRALIKWVSRRRLPGRSRSPRSDEPCSGKLTRLKHIWQPLRLTQAASAGGQTALLSLRLYLHSVIGFT